MIMVVFFLTIDLQVHVNNTEMVNRTYFKDMYNLRESTISTKEVIFFKSFDVCDTTFNYMHSVFENLFW